MIARRKGRARIRVEPPKQLSVGETVAFTTLSACVKAIDRLHDDAGSFRDPKLYNLIFTANSALKACLQEMETYEQYPEDS